MIRVLLFGRLGDLAGWRETVIEPVPPSLSALKGELARRWPSLTDALAGPGVQAAIDKAVVRGDPLLMTGAEVAFMPPMSGG
ncbi:MAG TPA: MoaD/ThiS family protein [Caulobacteraceae bacterium]|jgi:molybdopterin synthase sulfur carrier subunit